MSKYWRNFTIPYYDTDKEGYIKPENILSYMAETSSWHSDSLGVGFEELSKKDYAWMLLRWEAEILEYPKAKDNVVIGTWTSSFDRFYATREFVMMDVEENIVAKATTKWVFLDIKRRRPKRIPDEIQKRYSFVEDFNFPEFTEMDELSGDLVESRIMRVRRSDIDNNNHVNNIRYVEWMQEGLEDGVLDSMMLHKLGIVYKKEILPGDEFKTNWSRDEKNDKFFNHVISVNGELNAQGYTLWKPVSPMV
ncbi:acyl-[acyl-carrier-protein] thioesterase [Gudongella sp. DL1XJH-153]|uniref:acyl-[acyl-carrier-protein] thioesterase n=1 Tax=Gudongella sp. DL1XJH-153 TaxID=3409804 RepID=UPI003BB694DD